MRKCFYLPILLVFPVFNASAQLAKGNWLIGGNASFSSAKYINTVAASYSQIDIRISPMIGYFIIDKLPVGIRPGFSYTKTTLGTDYVGTRTFNMGPFVRYYFLPLESRVNLLSEVSYQRQISKLKDNPVVSRNGLSVLAGPVLYFNTSVAMEFTVGYSIGKFVGDAGSRNRTIQAGIGVQVYLEK